MKKTLFTNEEIAAICTELNYLLHAGIGNADALTNLAEDETRSEVKEIFRAMAEQADGGSYLSEVFRDSGRFPDYVVEMIDVGEKSGRVEDSLSALASSASNRASLDRSLKSALLYPAILLVIMLAVIAVLLVYVLPVFNDVYSQLGSGLTGIAGGLLDVGRALSSAMPVIIVIFGIIVVFLTLFAAVPSFREKVLDAIWSRRGDAGVAGKLNYARFAQALSVAMSSGMNTEDAITASAKLLPENEQAKCSRCIELMNNGSTLSASLRESGLLPASHCRLLEAGIRGGSGEQAMEEISNRLTEDSDIALAESVSKIEPILVIITSALVGLILLAVMLPLINIMAAIG